MALRAVVQVHRRAISRGCRCTLRTSSTLSTLSPDLGRDNGGKETYGHEKRNVMTHDGDFNGVTG
jgi:hypothetical protein